MKTALDKAFSTTRNGFTAADHIFGLKYYEQLNEMARIEHFRDSIEVSENHPYFLTTPEERQHALRIVDAQLELLKAIFPRMPKPEPKSEPG